MTHSTHRFRVKKPDAATLARWDHDTSAAQRNRSATRNAISACDWCRRLKKGCSKGFPECVQCVVSGKRCSYTQTSSVQVLKARVELLTSYIREKFGHEDETVEQLLAATAATAEAQGTENSAPALSVASDSPAFKETQTPQDESGQSDSQPNDHQPMDHRPSDDRRIHSSEIPSRPSGVDGLKPAHGTTVSQPVDSAPKPALASRYLVCVDAYFDHVHRAYPFINEEATRRVLSSSSFYLEEDVSDSIVLSLILAIGRTTLERSGTPPSKLPPHVEFSYSDVINWCLYREDTVSAQTLLLLALYSLFDPQSPSTWLVVGILTRQVMAQGLNCKVASVHDSSGVDIEFRRRLFWSTFILDRMMAVSIGQPPALMAEHSGIPLPTVTVEEFASPCRTRFASILQTNRHIIELRRLEGELLTSVHLRSPTDMANLTVAARDAVIQQLRTDIENWYTSGSLICKPQPDNVPIHSTITWMNARYYHSLVLLYWPCPFNARPQDTVSEDLQNYIRKSIQYSHVLFTHRQLPLNLITLNRLVISCLGLVYCFTCNSPTYFYANNEVQQSITLLRAFPATWDHARKLASLMVEFSTLVSLSQTPHPTDLHLQLVPPPLQNSSMLAASGQSQHKAWLSSLQQRLIEVLHNVSCRSTCYGQIFNWTEPGTVETGSASTDSSRKAVSEDPQTALAQINSMFL